MRKVIFMLVAAIVAFTSVAAWSYYAQGRKSSISNKPYSVSPVACSKWKFWNRQAVKQGDPCPGQHTCITYNCGGTSERSVCCPWGFRYLNHCDCQCYSSSDQIDCNSYSQCR